MSTAIHFDGLSKSFGSVEALSPLDLDVAEGEVLGYLGPNGAGKTTTIRLLLGLLKPSGGRASIFGHDTHADTIAAHKRLAYVPGEATLWPGLTGAETLHLLGKVQGQVDAGYREELIRRFDLDPRKKVRAYSKGNRQKLILIAALMTRADLLLLDEPTSGLDPLMEEVFRRSVMEAKSAGQTVFLSSHILSEVEAVCDRVAILRSGKLVEKGTLAEMRHLSAITVEATFAGTPPDVTKVPGIKKVKVVGNELRCQIQGQIEPLLKLAAEAGVTQFLSREPSLEELFLALYGEEDGEEGLPAEAGSGPESQGSGGGRVG